MRLSFEAVLALFDLQVRSRENVFSAGRRQCF